MSSKIKQDCALNFLCLQSITFSKLHILTEFYLREQNWQNCILCSINMPPAFTCTSNFARPLGSSIKDCLLLIGDLFFVLNTRLLKDSPTLHIKNATCKLKKSLKVIHIWWDWWYFLFFLDLFFFLHSNYINIIKFLCEESLFFMIIILVVT